jgi:preprotein translocase subunit SecG
MSFVLALSVLQNLVVVLFILICCAIILIVLLQKGRGGGIGAAFGGGGAGSLLGTKTGDFLTWVTICLVASFLVLAVLMGKFLRPAISSELSLPPGAATTTQQPAGTPAGGNGSIPETDNTPTTPAPETSVPAEGQTPPVAEEPAQGTGESAEKPTESTD